MRQKDFELGLTKESYCGLIQANSIAKGMDLKLSAFLATVGAKFWAATYKIPLKESIPHIASYGYGGVEIMPKERKIDAKKLRGMIKAHRI